MFEKRLVARFVADNTAYSFDWLYHLSDEALMNLVNGFGVAEECKKYIEHKRKEELLEMEQIARDLNAAMISCFKR